MTDSVITSRSVQKRLAVQSGPDVHVSNHGTIMLFDPQTEGARNWLQEHVMSDAQWFGGALVVEPRYAAALVDGLQVAGFHVS